jgi:NADH:ubiquinone oxidoreductase subunit D
VDLVQKVRAGNPKVQTPKVKTPAQMPMKQSQNSVDTKKGDSRAYVARDGKPISYEPIKAPRSATLAEIGRDIRSKRDGTSLRSGSAENKKDAS